MTRHELVSCSYRVDAEFSKDSCAITNPTITTTARPSRLQQRMPGPESQNQVSRRTSCQPMADGKATKGTSHKFPFEFVKEVAPVAETRGSCCPRGYASDWGERVERKQNYFPGIFWVCVTVPCDHESAYC
eukprot:1083639-Amorphochlora_amoeboformis.AAC.1